MKKNIKTPVLKKSNKPVDTSNDKMKEIAKEILQLRFKPNDTLKSCSKKFYDIMAKHGIKQGTQSYNDKGEESGILMNNFEWTMCHELFKTTIMNYFMWEGILKVPKSLQV